MTIDANLPPSLPDAFRALAQLTVTDPRLVFMTKEINLFIEVLHHQGQRQYFSPYDLKMLIARMTDLAHVAPHVPHGDKADPKPAVNRQETTIALDDLERETRRLVPPKVIPTKE